VPVYPVRPLFYDGFGPASVGGDAGIMRGAGGYAQGGEKERGHY